MHNLIFETPMMKQVMSFNRFVAIDKFLHFCGQGKQLSESLSINQDFHYVPKKTVAHSFNKWSSK